MQSASTGKTYRQARRRPAHLRTKTGCLSCRNRKKKCDENRTSCHNCRRLQIDCIWPQSKSFGPDDEDEQQAVSLSPPIEYDDINASDDTVNSELILDDLSSSQSLILAKHADHFAVPTLLLESDLQFLTSPFFDFMKEVFAPQLVMPTSDHCFVEVFTNQTLSIAFHTPHLMEALLACSGSETPTTGAFLTRAADVHYFKALSGLRTCLSSQVSQAEEITALRTILLLCMYEKSRMYCEEEVHLHLAGAAALIRSRCRQIETSTSMSDDDYVISLTLLEAFIFHATTCIPFHAPLRPSSDINQTFQTALEILQQHSPEDSSSFLHFRILGAPPALFANMRQVALLHLRYRSYNRLNMRQCHQLEQKLAHWDDNTFDRCPSYDTLETSTGRNHSGIGPRLYVIAAKIILASMIATDMPTRESLNDLISEAIELVRDVEISTPFFADYFSWPFYYLGICVSCQSHRDLLMDKITSFSGKGPMQRVAVMLKDEWKHKPAE